MAVFSALRKINQRMSLVMKAVVIAIVLFSIILPMINFYYLKVALSGNVQYLQSTSDTLQQGAVSLLEKKDITGACELFNSALSKDLLRFYIIQMNGNNICSGPADLEKEINAKYHVFNQAIDSGVIRFKSAQVGSFVVTAGTYNDSWLALWVSTRNKIPRMFLGWLVGVLVAVALAKIISIPFQKLNQKHLGQTDGKKSVLDILGSSKESTQAHRASDAFSVERTKLKTQISFIAPDFSKILLQRMTEKAGTFPFSFSGTILRFDLNGYTKLYFANDKQMIAKIIQAIAIDVDEVVSRYGGTHYGFGGDEFVELFEGEKRMERALFCARAIFSIAHRVNLPEEIRAKVKFKAAVASDDTMLFSRLPQCYSLVGDSLILTNRYFSAVEDRDISTLIVGTDEVPNIQGLVTSTDLGAQKFKNIEQQVKISKITDFMSLQKVLETKTMEHLEFFRTDEDILVLLNYLAAATDDLKKLEVLRYLKTINVSVCPPEIVSTWLSSLNATIKDKDCSARVVSSLINTGKNLIPKNMWREELTQILTQPEVLRDSRVVADVVELLSHKLEPTEFNIIADRLLLEDPTTSVRAQGNRLVAKCISGLNENLVAELGLLLKSEQPNVVATGIYCVARVTEHFWQENPVVLSQFLEFQDFISRINKLQNSTDKIVSARARIESKTLEGVQIGS